MNILITGGTGLIGTRLCQQLHQLGHELTVLSRKPETVPTFCKAIRSLDEWQSTQHFDAVINLAGESIVDKAWTTARKKVLWESRVGLTQSLVRCIEAADEKPRVFISGSAIGYYGNTGDKTLDEGAHVGKDFGAQLCDEWEKAALASSVRVCILRTGLVLAPSGGFLKKYLKERNSDIQIIGAQPKDGAKIPGIRKWPLEYLPKIFDKNRVDQIIEVSEEEARIMAQRLAKEEGVFGGMSSGGAVAIGLKVAENLKEGVVVCIICDRGDRYLSTDLFE